MSAAHEKNHEGLDFDQVFADDDETSDDHEKNDPYGYRGDAWKKGFDDDDDFPEWASPSA